MYRYRKHNGENIKTVKLANIKINEFIKSQKFLTGTSMKI